MCLTSQLLMNFLLCIVPCDSSCDSSCGSSCHSSFGLYPLYNNLSVMFSFLLLCFEIICVNNCFFLAYLFLSYFLSYRFYYSQHYYLNTISFMSLIKFIKFVVCHYYNCVLSNYFVSVNCVN